MGQRASGNKEVLLFFSMYEFKNRLVFNFHKTIYLPGIFLCRIRVMYGRCRLL